MAERAPIVIPQPRTWHCLFNGLGNPDPYDFLFNLQARAWQETFKLAECDTPSGRQARREIAAAFTAQSLQRLQDAGCITWYDPRYWYNRS